MDTNIAYLAIAALPLIFAISMHEAAHAYAARHFGDHTAEKLGRISLNPMRHIDPIGTILLPSLLFVFSNFWFGYAKPVPVNFGRLRNPKKDMLWVALAGPAANFFMALVWALLGALVKAAPPNLYSEALLTMGEIGIRINLILMYLNLLPLPPLDGGRIMVSLLPMPLAQRFARIEPFGFPILILLALSGALWVILGPLIDGTAFFIRLLFPFS